MNNISGFYDNLSEMERVFPKEILKKDVVAKEIFFNGEKYQTHVLNFKDPTLKPAVVAIKQPAAGSVERRSGKAGTQVLKGNASSTENRGVIKRFQEKYGLSDAQMEEYLKSAAKLTAFVSSEMREWQKKLLSLRYHGKISDDFIDAKLLSLALRTELHFARHREVMEEGRTHEFVLPPRLKGKEEGTTKVAPCVRLYAGNAYGLAVTTVDKEKVNLICFPRIAEGAWNEARDVLVQGNPRVIRQLQKHSLKKKSQLRQWSYEAELHRELAKVNPGILPIHHVIKLDVVKGGQIIPEVRGLITPKCHGNMYEMAHRNSLKESEKLTIMHQICTTTAKLHETHTHGDIKPENFLYRKENDGSFKVYMMDLQTAAPLGEREVGWGGTPIYQPPESFQDKFLSDDIETKIDDWALGMTGMMIEFPKEGEALLNALKAIVVNYPALFSCEDYAELEEEFVPQLPKDAQKKISTRWKKELDETLYAPQENFSRALNIVLDVVIKEPMNEALQPMRYKLKNSPNPYHSKVLYPLLHPDINQRIDAAEAARCIANFQKF
jgi:serine/threonine protein kinase